MVKLTNMLLKTSHKRRLGVRAAYWLVIAMIISAAIVIRQADPGVLARLRLLGFDALQQALPRAIDPAYPVRIIDIDERSLKAIGRWPWPRDVLARLVEATLKGGARSVAFDMVFPDAAAMPLDQLPEAVRTSAEAQALYGKLGPAASPDATLAAAIKNKPVVLGVIGAANSTTPVPKPKASFALIGENIIDLVPGYAGASSNIRSLDEAASGTGALNWFPDHDQILRKIPLVVRIGDRIYPSLAAETLRVFSGTKTIRVRSAGDGGFSGNRGITTVAIGDSVIPTDRDGQLWLSFSRRDPGRSISAADILDGKMPADALEGRIAVIGTSAPGLLDLRATPLDPVIAGVEINAQALEQLLSGRRLLRPDYAKGAEIALAVASALLLAVVVFFAGARIAAAVGAATVGAFVLGSLWAFEHGLLIDVAFPIMTNTAAYIFGTGYLYYEAESERNIGRETLQRIAREMEAAAQIQRTFLPKDLPAGPLAAKFEIAAIMKPAKSVGGDFFDYFLIGDTKLGVTIGDVSGKGVPAALFMSVSRTVLRTVAFEGEDPGRALTRVNAILARDNTEGMFVTIFYAVLDLETGALAFSSAGHDDAFLLTSSNGCEPLHYMGPAIGLFDLAEYPTVSRTLASGDELFLMTDGITEAFNIDGRVFTPERVVKLATRRRYESANDLLETITGEVTRFSEGTEQSDDITCVALRFKA